MNFKMVDLSKLIGCVDLPDRLFQGRGQIRHVVWPGGLRRIGNYCFMGTGLHFVQFSHCGDIIPRSSVGSSLRRAGRRMRIAEMRTGHGRGPVDPASGGHGLKWIGKGAFMDCRDLHVVDLPATVRFIGERCFIGTRVTSLDLAHLRSLRQVGAGALPSCVQDVRLPIHAGLLVDGRSPRRSSLISLDTAHAVVGREIKRERNRHWFPMLFEGTLWDVMETRGLCPGGADSSAMRAEEQPVPLSVAIYGDGPDVALRLPPRVEVIRLVMRRAEVLGRETDYAITGFSGAASVARGGACRPMPPGD
jgi:hypothetical protein